MMAWWKTMAPRERLLIAIAGILTMTVIGWQFVLVPSMAARAEAEVRLTQRWRKVKSDASSVDEKALLLHAVILCDGDINSLFDISNEFYEMCGTDPFIVKDKHVSLGQIMESDVPDFVVDKMSSFNTYMDKYIGELAEKYYSE